MYLRRIEIEGYRASAEAPLVCEFSGRFSLVVGANGAGKTTINEAIALAHPHRFPRLPPVDAAVLGKPPRSVRVEYAYESAAEEEGAFGSARKLLGFEAPKWGRTIERSLGKVRAGRIEEPPSEYEDIRLVHLPALRNPVDDLSRRDARVLLELLRAEERRDPTSGGLAAVRTQAERMLASLSGYPLVSQVEERIAQNLLTISGGVREHHAYIGTQIVDDTYLARVLEILLAILPDRGFATRLEASSLGYVNLLHIAVTLAGIPDAGSTEVTESESEDNQSGPDSGPNVKTAREALETAEQEADADADSFYPELFHATVLIEEPEAHLHPQLQHGLIRYLRRLVSERGDLQIIVTTHSSDLIAACDPEELVVVRRGEDGAPVSRRLMDIPIGVPLKEQLFQQTRLHFDSTRSSALFADRLLLVEGVTEGSLLRVLGRVWAASDDARSSFVEALSILPLGHKVGQWPIRLLATQGHELVGRVAALSDTDKRGNPLPAPAPPSWQPNLSFKTARFFWSRPTLEPSLVPGNEDLIGEALEACGQCQPKPITPSAIDSIFQATSKIKGTFSLELADLIRRNPSRVTVPTHIAEMFEWLFTGEIPSGNSPHEGDLGVW